MTVVPKPPTKEQREANNRVRDYLRSLREKNVDLTMAQGQAKAEKKFPDHVFPRTSFKQTYWDKAEPAETELEYEEGVEEDEQSLLWIEPAGDGQSRLCVDFTDTAERVFAAAAALTGVLACGRDNVSISVTEKND